MDKSTRQIIGSSLAVVLVLAGAALIYYSQARAGAILLATAAVCLGFTFGGPKRCGSCAGVEDYGQPQGSGESTWVKQAVAAQRGNPVKLIAIFAVLASFVAAMGFVLYLAPAEHSIRNSSVSGSIVVACAAAITTALAAAASQRRRTQK